MQVQQLTTQSIQCCQPGDSLQHAASLMWGHDCGCVPVCESDGGSRPVGVITDRDICMCALFQGKPLSQLSVEDAMAREVKAVRARDSIAQAEQIMRDARIRRVPVIDDRGGLVGMLSLSDLAREAARGRGRTGQNPSVGEAEVNETLAVICEPNRDPLIA
jgi:CBS domain-containing protein